VSVIWRRRANSRPRSWPATAVLEALKESPSVGPTELFIEIHVWNDRSADEQRLLVWVVSLKLDPHRQPLDDFDEVARRILRREQRKCRTGPHCEAADSAFEHLSVAIHVDVEIGGLTDAQIAQLRLLEVGVDPDIAERADRHQALPDLDIIARIDIPARDDAVDFRNNIAVAKVEFSQREVALGGLELGLGLLDGRRLCSQAIECAVDIALFELFDYLLRRLVVGMENAQLSRRLKQLRQGLQNRRERLIEIGRHLVEIRAVLVPGLEP